MTVTNTWKNGDHTSTSKRIFTQDAINVYLDLVKIRDKNKEEDDFLKAKVKTYKSA